MYPLDDNIIQILGYHNHNYFCDGMEPLENYVQEAVKQNVKHLGFSSHAPFFFDNKWSISPEKLLKYIDEIEFLAKKHQEVIKLFKSLEIDFLPGKIHSFEYFKQYLNLDYTIGSIHYILHPISGELLFIDGAKDDFIKNFIKVFNGNIRLVLETYYNQTMEMITTQKPDIIGHIDKISMNTFDLFNQNGSFPSWYIDIFRKTLETAVEQDAIVELNMRGLIKGKWASSFPHESFLHICRDLNVKIVISSDAHHPSEVASFYQYGLDLLKQANINFLMKKTSLGWEKYEI
jgi:histidinol-phosphatase (PHP family)